MPCWNDYEASRKACKGRLADGNAVGMPKMKITWLGQGGYLIEHSGHCLAVDPYLTDALGETQGFRRLSPPPFSMEDIVPDAVFITHDHLDHFDPETVDSLLRQSPTCLLIGPQSVIEHGRRLALEEQRLVLASVGKPLSLLSFLLTPTPARHSDRFAVGLLVKVSERLIYISGDTLYDSTLAPQIDSLAGRQMDAAFVCINGRLGNMESAEAAKLVAALKPVVAVPMHYGMFAENTADPREFVTKCRVRGQETLLLEAGRSVVL